MKNYKIEDALTLFRNCGLNVIKTEGLKVQIVDRPSIKKFGKIKKSATYKDLDIFAFYNDAIFLVEFTSEDQINTKDFQDFILKIQLLLDENKKRLKEFIKKLKNKYPKEKLLKNLNIEKCEIRALYIKPRLKVRDERTLSEMIPKNYLKIIYIWDKEVFEYFKIISNTIRNYSKYELFSYFNIDQKYIFDKKELNERYKISDIQDFVKISDGVYGYPMYTFKVKPTLLLDRMYVLRNEGWRSDSFQRMIIPGKLYNIRDYILKNKGTHFANNIIVSLNPSINEKDVFKEDKITLPHQFGSVCIIDGQHRLLAFTQNFYGEKEEKEDARDNKLNKLAKNSYILVTIIGFRGSDRDIVKKQTQLFLDINSTQTKIKTDFIYNLKEITDPRSSEAIGNKMIKYLTLRENGIFEDKFEIKSYDHGKIKRSSIITYGLRELVDPVKNFFFSLTQNSVKEKFQKEDVDDYVQFCGDKLEKYFKIIKKVFIKKLKNKDLWDIWRKSGYMILSTSSIVAFLRLYRHFVLSNVKLKEMPNYIKRINVDFEHKNWVYSSSQWGKLESKMFYDIRAGYSNFGNEDLIPKKHRK